MTQATNKGRFVKGDPRINREGRPVGKAPKSQEELRRLIHDIAHEEVTSKDGSITATRIEAILMNWATSGDVRKQELFVAYGYGKIKEQNTALNLNLNECTDEQLIRIANGEDAASVLASTRNP
jgi:hypothetical protein